MNDQLQGLLIPSQEAGYNTMLWLGLVLLFSIFGGVLWRWNIYRKNPSVIAQKELRNLMNLPCKTGADSQVIAIKIASVLCRGLGVTRLDQFQTEKINQWEEFLSKLNTACYSSVGDTEEESVNIKSLLNDAKEWLIHIRTSRMSRTSHMSRTSQAKE